jgi:hypothetical protein
MTIGITPMITKTAQGTFGVQWDGLTQGTDYPAPNAIYNLAGGYVAPTETDPMYGGIGISENVPTPQGSPATTPALELGGPIARAAQVQQSTGPAQLDLTGFSVFTQDYAMINSPQSPVPLADIYMQVNFYRLGSGARIAVAIDPALVNLYGRIITSIVGWDFTLQRLIAGTATNTLPVKVLRVQPANCMTINYTSASKTAAWNYNGAAAVILI